MPRSFPKNAWVCCDTKFAEVDPHANHHAVMSLVHFATRDEIAQTQRLAKVAEMRRKLLWPSGDNYPSPPCWIIKQLANHTALRTELQKVQQ